MAEYEFAHRIERLYDLKRHLREVSDSVGRGEAF